MIPRNLGRATRDEIVLALARCVHAGEISKLHAQIPHSQLRSNTFLGNHLLQAYGRCGDARSALSVFSGLHRRNVFSWNLMIAACGVQDRAMVVYRSMLLAGEAPDAVTFVNLLAAGRDCSLAEGRSFHAAAAESGWIDDVAVGTAIVSLYARFGRADDARRVFDSMRERNLVSWTAMITAYAREGHRSSDALELFRRMARIRALEPDRVALISLLESCTAGSLALEHGRGIEREVLFRGLGTESSIVSALIAMYGRCSSVDDARRVLDRSMIVGAASSIAWTSLIFAYACVGHLVQALETQRLMALDGQACDSVTFLHLLFACSHAGNLHDCWTLVLLMRGDFGVESLLLDHWVCVLDLLGRLGKLGEAEGLVRNMPFEPPELVWKSLLSACIIHGDDERAEKVAKYIIAMNSSLCS